MRSRASIEEDIPLFLTPESKKTHDRPIYRTEAQKCGLNIDSVDAATRLWQLVYELHIRTNEFVSSSALKCIESSSHSFFVPYEKGKIG